MDLAKAHIDPGLYTNQLDSMLEFWQGAPGLTYQELLKTGGGNHQHRHGRHGSVFKLNHVRDPLPDAPPSGYVEWRIADPGRTEAEALCDPDGNRVLLVPSGNDGVERLGVHLAVRNESDHHRFLGRTLGLEKIGPSHYLAGDSVLSFERSDRAPADATLKARGYRYITFQVRDCDQEHAGVLERGGREGMAPRTLGEVARISFVRDPDGNWIEISQRASLVGPLDPPSG